MAEVKGADGLDVGDVVVLNSAHEQRMTVELCNYNHTTGNIVTCVWLDPQNRSHRDSFPRAALTRILTKDEARERVKELYA